jgi:hypothetical protein
MDVSAEVKRQAFDWRSQTNLDVALDDVHWDQFWITIQLFSDSFYYAPSFYTVQRRAEDGTMN